LKVWKNSLLNAIKELSSRDGKQIFP